MNAPLLEHERTKSIGDSSAEVLGVAVEVPALFASRFELLRELGHGASGTVFEARDQAMGDRSVALKILHRLGPHAAYRFKNEFRSAAFLVHPNLVAVHELFVDGSGALCIVMDMIDGQGLVPALRERDEGCGELTRDAIAQVVAGTQALHDAGLVHCDLKPSNVLMSASGHVSIIDFGLACVWQDAPDEGGGFRGTPAYAAPEQLAGAPATPAADWYAIGVMLYELLSGRRPFPSNAGASRGDGQTPALEDPGGSTLREALTRVCMRLLSPSPDERATGDDILRALELEDARQPNHLLPSPELFGRGAELERLNAALDRALSGSGSVVLLRGDAGVGKTFLAEKFLEQAASERRAIVLRSRCHTNEATTYRALDGLMDVLSEWLRRMPTEYSNISSEEAHAIGTLFPVLLRGFSSPPGKHETFEPSRYGCAELDTLERQGAQTTVTRNRAVRALRNLLQRLASKRALILYVDDLHWGDADSASLLLDLFAEPSPASVLLVATYTPVDLEAPSTVAALLRQPTSALFIEHIDLPSLPPLASIELLRCYGVPAARVRPLAASANGNPARLHAIAAEELGISSSNRLSTLTEAERAVLRVLVVAGRPLRHDLLARVEANASHAVLRRLRLSRWTRESLVHGALHVEPRDSRIAELVGTTLRRTERSAIHSRLGDAALRLGDSHFDAAVEHLVLAGRGNEAIGPALRAAKLAEQSFAFHRQAELLQLVLAHLDESRPELLIDCAKAHAKAGNVGVAAEHYERAAHHEKSDVAFDLRCKAMSLYFLDGRTKSGLALAHRLRRELELNYLGLGDTAPFAWFGLIRLYLTHPKVPASATADIEPRAQRTLGFLVSLALATGRVQTTLAGRCWLDALRLAQRVGDRDTFVQALCALSNASIMIWGRPLPGGVELLENDLSTRNASEEHRLFLGFLGGMRGLFSGAHDAAVSKLLPVAKNTGVATPLAVATRSYSRLLVLPALFFLGRMRQLDELSHRWLAEAERAGNLQDQVSLGRFSLFRHLRDDNIEKALARLQEVRAIPLEVDQSVFIDPWWDAWIHLYAGDPAGALDACELSRFRWQSANWRILNHRAAYWFVTGSAWAALAAKDSSRRVAMRELAKARRKLQRIHGHRRCAQAFQLVATEACLEGRYDDAIPAFRAAVQAYDDLGHEMFAASVRLRLASLGEREHQPAGDYFRNQGIIRPERWANMLVPGFEHPPRRERAISR